MRILFALGEEVRVSPLVSWNLLEAHHRPCSSWERAHHTYRPIDWVATNIPQILGCLSLNHILADMDWVWLAPTPAMNSLHRRPYLYLSSSWQARLVHDWQESDMVVIAPFRLTVAKILLLLAAKEKNTCRRQKCRLAERRWVDVEQWSRDRCLE